MKTTVQAAYVLALGGSLLCAAEVLAAEEPEKALTEAVQSEQAKTRRVIFECPKEQMLTVEFLGSEPGATAVVRPPDGNPVTLKVQMSGSGFRYADDTYELSGKGREVTWTDQTKRPIVCTEQTPAPLGTEPN